MASQINQFIRLRGRDKALLVEALVIVGAVRLALWMAPFNLLRGFIARQSVRVSRRGRRQSVEKLARAIELTSRFVPAASCLTQALAGQALLGRAGYASTLRIGVRNDPAGLLKAHAWLDCDGITVLGGEALGVDQYTPLPPI